MKDLIRGLFKKENWIKSDRKRPDVGGGGGIKISKLQ
jgi:hypothetical protein